MSKTDQVGRSLRVKLFDVRGYDACLVRAVARYIELQPVGGWPFPHL